MSRSLSRVLLLALGLALMAGGCRRGPAFTFAPVEGTITKNGQPLPNVEVVFIGDPNAGTRGPRASALTDENGRYRLRGDRGETGAVPGKHRVCIVDLLANPETPMEKRRMPPSYGRINETPLRAEIRPGPQTLDFDLP